LKLGCENVGTNSFLMVDMEVGSQDIYYIISIWRQGICLISLICL
jgi:hypothetical protein